jgi:hypothetical protein
MYTMCDMTHKHAYYVRYYKQNMYTMCDMTHKHAYYVRYDTVGVSCSGCDTTLLPPSFTLYLTSTCSASPFEYYPYLDVRFLVPQSIPYFSVYFRLSVTCLPPGHQPWRCTLTDCSLARIVDPPTVRRLRITWRKFTYK